MRICESAAVIGLGLIGGSVARDLAARGVRVRGFDAEPAQLAAAARDGVISDVLDSSLAGVHGADVIVVAVPVDATIAVLRTLAPYASGTRLITDVGSTKARIVEAAAAFWLGDRFVGSHPMAGDHRSGWSASRTGLFAGARVFLCPAENCESDTTRFAADFWRSLDAQPSCIDAEEHDRQLAWTSHLPHMVSSALAMALARSGVQRSDLGPGGRDVTRLAGSSPEMWAAIACDNAPAIDAALAAAESELAALRVALSRRDAASLRAHFAEARGWFGG